MIRNSFFYILLCLCMTSLAQELEQHRWQERVLLVFGEQEDTPALKKQFELLTQAQEGLEERKLVVYQVLPDYCSLMFQQKESIPRSPSFKHKKTKAPFEIVLIGLDSGVKLRQTKILTTEELFALIDGMPMRKAELRQKQKN